MTKRKFTSAGPRLRLDIRYEPAPCADDRIGACYVRWWLCDEAGTATNTGHNFTPSEQAWYEGFVTELLRQYFNHIRSRKLPFD